MKPLLFFPARMNFILLYRSHGFLHGSDGKASAYNAGDPGSILGREDPLEKEMATHSSTLKIPWMEEPGRLHTVHGVAKSQTQLSDFTSCFSLSKIIVFLCLCFRIHTGFRFGWKMGKNSGLSEIIT